MLPVATITYLCGAGAIGNCVLQRVALRRRGALQLVDRRARLGAHLVAQRRPPRRARAAPSFSSGSAVSRSTASSGLARAHAQRAAVPVGGAPVEHAAPVQPVDHQVRPAGRRPGPRRTRPKQRSTVRSMETVVFVLDEVEDGVGDSCASDAARWATCSSSTNGPGMTRRLIRPCARATPYRVLRRSYRNALRRTPERVAAQQLERELGVPRHVAVAHRAWSRPSRHPRRRARRR